MGCGAVYTKSDFTIPELPDKINEDISFQHFKKIKLLGQGSFGKVYLIESKETGKHYALKEIYFGEKKNPNLGEKKNPNLDGKKNPNLDGKNNPNLDGKNNPNLDGKNNHNLDEKNNPNLDEKQYPNLKIKTEIENLKKIDHPNIISFKGSFKSKEKEKTYNIITEYVDNGDLYKLLKEKKEKEEYFEEKQLLNWLIQMCLALYNLHEEFIIHRDIKPSNIFLMKDNTIKLGDFGISKDISLFHRTKTKKGTPLYMAPEILKKEKYDFKIDVWSLGVTFCHLMTLEFPFYSKKLEEDIKKGTKNKKILNDKGNNYNDIILKRYSKEFLDIIDEMMTIDPKGRPEIEDILQKKIVIERMESLLIESKFNFEKADIEIKKYQENEQRIIKLIKERLNKKKEQFNEENVIIIIEDISEKDIIEEKNENAILTQEINKLQNGRLKYDYLRQMSLIHKEKLKRFKTAFVNF